MNRLLLLGILLSLAAGVIALFEAIRDMMSVGEITFSLSSPVELLGNAAFAWIDRIPALWIQEGLNYIFNLPAWLLVLSLGILCFIIAGIRSR
jgi:hypothetical protein